jgi:ArsR family transcriptional regulator
MRWRRKRASSAFKSALTRSFRIETACLSALTDAVMPSAKRNGTDAKFRAFSDQTRLRILHLLKAGELCVGDLVEIIGVPQPTASRHLAYLRRAELVITRKHGQWTYYALAPAKKTFHKHLLECLSKCFDEVPEIQKDATRAAKLKKTGDCCAR